MLDYCKPSGKLSPIASVYLLLACAIMVPILGVIHVYTTWYMPTIYVNLFITFGFRAGISFVVSLLVIRLGKVRNYGFLVLFAIIAPLVAYYSRWIVWVDLVLNAGEAYGNEQMGISVSNAQFEQLLYLATHPNDPIGLIMLINEEGTWGIKSMTVSDILLSIIWLIEFGAIMFSGSMTAGRSRVFFGEVTEERFKEEELPTFAYIDNPNSFKQVAGQGSWETLAETLQLTDRQASHSLFTAYVPGNDYYPSVYDVKAKTNSKGKVEFDTDEFMKYLHINKTIYDMLKAKA